MTVFRHVADTAPVIEPCEGLEGTPFDLMPSPASDELSPEELRRAAQKAQEQQAVQCMHSLVGEMRVDVAALRADVVSFLAAVFGGDELTAEYALLHSLSHVHSRIEGRAIGKLSLNICGLPEATDQAAPQQPIRRLNDFASDSAAMIASFLAQLTPRSALIPTSNRTLHELRFAPTSVCSPAQRLLLHRSHSVCDVRTPRPAAWTLACSSSHVARCVCWMSQHCKKGSCSQKRCKTCAQFNPSQKSRRYEPCIAQFSVCLNTTITLCQLPYDFQFYARPFETDVAVLILSHARSLISTDCVLYLSQEARDGIGAIVHGTAEPPAPSEVSSQLRVCNKR